MGYQQRKLRNILSKKKLSPSSSGQLDEWFILTQWETFLGIIVRVRNPHGSDRKLVNDAKQKKNYHGQQHNTVDQFLTLAQLPRHILTKYYENFGGEGMNNTSNGQADWTSGTSKIGDYNPKSDSHFGGKI